MSEEIARICPICLRTLPTERISKNEGIYLHRTCPENEEFETLIWKKALVRNWNGSIGPLILWIHPKSLSIMAIRFQDQGNLYLERLKKCRLQIATKDKKLIPFCVTMYVIKINV